MNTRRFPRTTLEAWPTRHPYCIEIPSKRMTLRDYFAAKAMQSVLRGARIPGADADPLPPEVSQALAAIAKVSYRVADAMLAERHKQ